MQKIRVAVVGYGHLGRFHAQKVDVLEASELVAIVDANKDRALLAKEAHPHANVVADLKDIISEIDAAIIVTPTSTHFEIAKYLIEQKKHVFCEKPITEKELQALELGALVEKQAIVFQAGHSERFHEIFERVDDFQEYFSGPCFIRLDRIAAFKGRATDVDVVQDLMIHDLDLISFLFKETPVSIEAKGFKIRTSKWDHVTAILDFASGKKAFVTVGRNFVKEVRSLDVTSSNGTFFVDLMKNEVLIASKNAKLANEYVKIFSYNKRDHLLLEQDHFYKSIINRTKPIVSVKDGQFAIRLLDFVIKALESGHKENVS